MTYTRPSTKVIKQFPEGETFVDMTTFRDRLYIATNLKMYILTDDVLIPLTIRTIE